MVECFTDFASYITWKDYKITKDSYGKLSRSILNCYTRMLITQFLRQLISWATFQPQTSQKGNSGNHSVHSSAENIMNAPCNIITKLKNWGPY